MGKKKGKGGVCKIIFMALAILLAAVQADAFNPASITFGITSTAATSTPNLRVAVMTGQLAKDGNVPVQAFTVPASQANYYLTKSKVYTISNYTTGIWIQVDQDTKMYTGSDLTNYMLLKSGVDYSFSTK